MAEVVDVPQPGDPHARPCRSWSRFGSCGRTIGHAHPHAVPIGGGVWFGYLRAQVVTPLGYGRFNGDTFELLGACRV
ncbi:hypothetical protein [Micromonospora sp. RV43]|uniref:hypothetical protein n=1 Tax=Micromonospora sp. RV43 TaxID=1661387 RepID=UPI000A5C1317|nr:hypothetical protein [Micromonospora sp. RV43]